MKQSRLIVVVVSLGILSACGRQVVPTSQPSTPNNSLETAEAYLMRGDSYSEIEDYVHAIADYDQALRLKPDSAEADNNRGYAHYWNYEGDKAIADYTQAIRLRPDYAYAFNNRGAAYMASGHADQAISDFDRAIQLQPNFPQAYTNRGNAYMRLGQFGRAFADFRRAGSNPVKTVALLCGLLTITVLLGAAIIVIFRQRLRARGEDTI